MKQNKYDDPRFFANYSKMPRSVGGLDEAQEWHAFRALLPDLADKPCSILAAALAGIAVMRAVRKPGRLSAYLSEKMLAQARATTDDTGIEYRRCAMEDIDFPAGEFEVVISSLALHYVERLDLVCQRVHQCLAAGGAVVISVEHPIFTALAAQQWCYGRKGERLHWPVDDYQQEGPRHTSWLADDVVKYHRTVATYVNTLIASGFGIVKLVEPEPPPEMLTPEMLIEQPALKDDCRRPTFLLIAADKARQGPMP